MLFAGLFENLYLQFAAAMVLFDPDIEFFRNTGQVIEVPQLFLINIRVVLDNRLLNGHARERLCKVVLLALVADLRFTEQRFGHAAKHCLDHLDQVLVIGVGTI